MIKHQSDYEKMINRVDKEIEYKKKSGITEYRDWETDRKSVV